MKYLQHHWRKRLLVLAVVSIIVSILMITLELTEWAEQINTLGYSHDENDGDKGKIPAGMMYILPFIKEIVLIGIPLLLTLLWIKVFKKFKQITKPE